MTKSESHYSIWTLPKELWKDPLENLDLSKIKKADIKKNMEKNKESMKRRLKAFNTPIDFETLNKIILP